MLRSRLSFYTSSSFPKDTLTERPRFIVPILRPCVIISMLAAVCQIIPTQTYAFSSPIFIRRRLSTLVSVETIV